MTESESSPSSPAVMIVRVHPDVLAFVTMIGALETIIVVRREELQPWESEEDDPIIQTARDALDQAVIHAG